MVKPSLIPLERQAGRSDVVLVTGGLGPTSDDITREALAEVLGVEMIEDEAALRSLHEFFEKRSKPMVDANLKPSAKLSWCGYSAE